MKKRNQWKTRALLILIMIMVLAMAPVEAKATESELASTIYAKGAVLLDGDSGRVLYSKNGQEIMPMASTTKIMTCILALEYGKLDEWVTFSAYAASAPKVHLGAKTGRNFLLGDLLYSLMLESHNDTAIAIAEHIGTKMLESQQGEVDEHEIDSKMAVDCFVELMNQKAKELGCQNTFFVTPNGLDGTKEVMDENGHMVLKRHSTTAQELARIMKYCVYESEQKQMFLDITRTANYSFWDKDKVVCYSCGNHNALLNMLPQAVSGKTGFTNAAGYCYVGVLEEGEKRFVVALLACGWPNNKNYKWSDCKKLFSYGNETYEYKTFQPEVALQEIAVKNGKSLDGNPYSTRKVMPVLENGESMKNREYEMLVKEDEEILARLNQQLSMNAPVIDKKQVGVVEYYRVNKEGEEEILDVVPLYVQDKIEEKDFIFVLRYVMKQYLDLG